MEPTLFSEFLAHYSDAYLEAEQNKKLIANTYIDDSESVMPNSDANGKGDWSLFHNPGEESQLPPKSSHACNSARVSDVLQ